MCITRKFVTLASVKIYVRVQMYVRRKEADCGSSFVFHPTVVEENKKKHLIFTI
jgi:hypothetical protein